MAKLTNEYISINRLYGNASGGSPKAATSVYSGQKDGTFKKHYRVYNGNTIVWDVWRTYLEIPDSIKINDKGLGTNANLAREVSFISPDGEFNFGKITSELTVNTAHDRFSNCSYDGNTLSLTSSSTGSNSYFTNIFYVNFDDFIFRISKYGIYVTKDGKEYDILDLLEKGGGSGGGSEGGCNVIFVDSLPSDAEPGKLYVIS